MKLYRLFTNIPLILLTSIINMLPLITKAQQQELFAILDVDVQDTAMLNEGEIAFKVYQNNINTDLTSQTETIPYGITASRTRLKIPLSTAVNYVRIDYSFKHQIPIAGMASMPLNHENNLFIFRAGDSIKIILKKNAVSFEGKGSEKYNIAFELSAHKNILKSQKSLEESLFREGNYQSCFAASKRHQDSLFEVKKGILERYSSYLDRDIYRLMLADCWADYNRSIIGRIFTGTKSFVRQYGPVHTNAVKDAYEAYLAAFDHGYLPDSILAKSFKYCDFLLWKEYSAQYLYNANNGTDGASSAFIYRYNSIQKSYNGIIRDKVALLNFYFSNSTRADLDLVSEDALATTIHEPYRQELIQAIEGKTGEAFPFALPDKNGKIHKLEDFKGKLIVMDFWYTGCINCIELAEKLKPIIKDFRENPKVVFLSVSIDGDKYRDVWLKSLESEKYSSKEEINLLAQGKNADIIKHYNIQGYPTLLVISKDGRVITLGPPDPRVDSKVFRDFIIDNL